MTRKQIERIMAALAQDIRGETTAGQFVAMCRRYEELKEMLADEHNNQ